MTQKKLQIHTENILPIIKKWLYSDKDIFLRELVSNACDALNKLKILREHKEADVKDEEMRVDIILNQEEKTLKIIDTGIGMTAEEVEKYIAQVAFSGAEEFLGKYKTENDKEAIIGHFGLGFYSAYMVSSKVEINTLSYRENAEPVFWSCDGSADYTIEKGTKEARGTEITLFIDKDSEEFLDAAKIKTILNLYCAFLPFPIHFNEEKINDKEPLWLKAPSECTEEEYLDFYQTLYPFEEPPIFWIHLNVDYPFNLKGILYFPKVNKRFDWNQSHIKLFCNRVFVSDNCKDLIPDFLMILKGAIDSPDIPLNVSRSYLQMDKTVRQLSSHVSKKVTDRLQTLYKTEQEKFTSSWKDIETIVKLGCLQDEKFYEKAKEFLIWQNTEGNWTRIEDYLERNEGKHKDKIFYTAEDKGNAGFLNLYKEKNIEVLVANAPIDSALINTLERKHSPAIFQRTDGGIDDAILDKARENTEAHKIADFVKANLGEAQVEVEAKSLHSDNLPAFIVVNEHMRRMRDYMALTGQEIPSQMLGKNTFVVNTNSKLINAIYGMQEKKPLLAKEMIAHVYELSLLSQKELETKQLSSFIERSSKILEEMLLDA